MKWAMRVGALAACAVSATGVAPADAEVSFDRYEVVLDRAKRQTVLTGFLLDGAMADLAVLKIEENGHRRLRIYTFDEDTFARKLETTLRPGVRFVDVARIGGRDRLVTYEPGRLSWFDPESGQERELVAVSSGFGPPRTGEIPHVDITQDVNGDGRDDLVVPDRDGFRIFVQTDDGGFADPVKLGPPTDLARIYGADGYRYDPWSVSRIHEIDYDRDGRADLVFWKDDHFEVHRQNEHGLFESVAETFTTDVAFDSDDPSWLAGGAMRGRVLHSLTELNGDGVADLVVASLQGDSPSRKRSTHEVHLGRPAPGGGTVFPRRVDFSFRSDERVQIGLERHDLDGDGRVELMLTTIENRFLTRSLWKIIKGFMGDDIGLDLEFYRMEGGRYRDKPNTIHRIALDGPPSHRERGWIPLELVLLGATHQDRSLRKGWPSAFNSTLLVGDLTGDGLSDLILGSHPRQLAVLVGVPGPGLFAKRAHAVRVAVSNDEEYTWLVDLNRDGKQDILLHHPFIERNGHGAPLRPPGSEPHRVTLLIAQ